MKMGEGCMLVYSVTSSATFEDVKKLRTQVLRLKEDQPDFPILLVGNKIDVEDRQRVVSTEQGEDLCEQWKQQSKNTGFIETSAKVGVNVAESFIALIRLINDWREANPPPEKKKKKKGGCTLI
jgi:GTPase SAR1 family protein